MKTAGEAYSEWVKKVARAQPNLVDKWDVQTMLTVLDIVYDEPFGKVDQTLINDCINDIKLERAQLVLSGETKYITKDSEGNFVYANQI